MATVKGTTEAKTEVAALLQENFSDTAPAWATKSNKGSEDVTSNDMVLPRINVLQALSPQINKRDSGYIDGAEQGIIFNTVTNELYGESVTFVPVKFKKEFVVWKLRTAGGGFCGAYDSMGEAVAAVGAMQNPADYEAVESHQHFVMLLTATGTEEAVFSMTKSMLKTSRSLNTLVQIAGVSRFAKAYKAVAVEVSGDKGVYWSLKVNAAGFVSKEIHDKGEALCDMITAGMATVDRSAQGVESVVESAEL